MNRLMKDLAVDRERNAGVGLDDRWEDEDEEGEEDGEDEFETMDRSEFFIVHLTSNGFV